MFRSIALSLLALFILSENAYAAKRELGVGMIVSDSTGISVKKWLQKDSAIDGAITYSTSGSDELGFHVDYLRHNDKLLRELFSKNVAKRLSVYFGIGGRLKILSIDEEARKKKKKNEEDDVVFGFRVPLGIAYMFKDTPVEIFAEGVPTLDVNPEADFGWKAGFGFRYYFK